MGDREYDFVVFGATGYTGQFVNEELYRLQTEEGRTFKWAAAGRSQSKLEACLNASGIEGIDTIVADVSNQASLEAMCSKATVLMNCVGPYQLYGEPVVKACISQKTNYVDITGETYFMESIAARYDMEAHSAGIYIVSSCGFDSIPNDLGAMLLQRTFNGDLAYAESYLSIDSGGRPFRFNIGTWESFLRSISNHSKLSALRREQNHTPLPLPAAKPPKRSSIFYSNLAGRWCLPFPGADRAVVYRSMRYRKDNTGVEPFNFRTYVGASSIWQCVGVVFGFLMLFPMLMTRIGLKLLIKFPRFFSFGFAINSGPAREELENTTFSVVVRGTGYAEEDDKSKPPKSKISVKVWGIDPGYGATSAMLVQAALCFIDEKDKLPPTGGVYTPAVAFGDTKLIQNLENTGKVKFAVLPE